VAGISCVTNLAAGISPHALSHAEVIETTTRVAAQFEGLVERCVAALEPRPSPHSEPTAVGSELLGLARVAYCRGVGEGGRERTRALNVW
jgi:hypothetical protein